MPVPTSIDDLSTTASVNSPQGNESAKGNVDNFFRAGFAFIASLRDLVAGKAAKGANSDITSLSGLTTPLSVAQGGTGGGTEAAARTAIGAMAANSGNITATAGGTADAITATFSPAITAITEGLRVQVYGCSPNTVTNPTLNINGLGALTIVDANLDVIAVGAIPEKAEFYFHVGTPNLAVLMNPSISVQAASETVAGIAEIATQAEVTAGTDDARIVTPLKLKTALGFTKPYSSGSQTITAGGALTLAHGLGVVPVEIYTELVCATSEHGYTAGQVVPIQNDSKEVATSTGFAVAADATNIYVKFGTGAAPLYLRNLSTAAVANLTNANWGFVVRARG